VWATEQLSSGEGEIGEHIIEVVQSSGPSCATYVMSVIEVAKQIGSQPMLLFLDRFAKNYGASKALGEEFFKAIYAISFSKSNKLVFLKCATIATNLVAHCLAIMALIRLLRAKRHFAAHGTSPICISGTLAGIRAYYAPLCKASRGSQSRSS